MESKNEQKNIDGVKKILRFENILVGNMFLRKCGKCVVVSIFMGIIFCFVLMCNAICEAKTSEETDIEHLKVCEEDLKNDSLVPISADEYAYNNFESVIEVIKQFNNFYHMTKEQLCCVKLGEPFVINDIKEKSQEEIFYYPIYDFNDNLMLVMSVIKTTDGWTHSVSEEWVS